MIDAMNSEPGPMPLPSLTIIQQARMLAAVRCPRILRYLAEASLSEPIHEFLHRRPIALEAENYAIGLVSALRPLLLTTIDAYRTVPPARRRLAVVWDGNDEDFDADFELDDNDPAHAAAVAVEGHLAVLSDDELCDLARHAVNRIEGAMEDVLCLSALERVLIGVRSTDPIIRHDCEVLDAVRNSPCSGYLITVLRDVRRIR